MSVQPIPEGFSAVSPYLAVANVRSTIEFLKKAFDAEELSLHAMPDGRIMNAILKIRGCTVFFGEVTEANKAWPAMLYMYVADVDAAFKKAVNAGGKTVMEPQDMYYGERSGAVEDPSGNQWWMASHIEEMSDEELIRRAVEKGK